MNLAYTDSFSTSTEVIIRKDVTPGGGVIPNTVTVRAISIWPDKADGSYPAFYIKGMDSNAGWIKFDSEMPIFTIEGLDDLSSKFFYIMPVTGSITFNLLVKGAV